MQATKINYPTRCPDQVADEADAKRELIGGIERLVADIRERAENAASPTGMAERKAMKRGQARTLCLSWLDDELCMVLAYLEAAERYDRAGLGYARIYLTGVVECFARSFASGCPPDFDAALGYAEDALEAATEAAKEVCRLDQALADLDRQFERGETSLYLRVGADGRKECVWESQY